MVLNEKECEMILSLLHKLAYNFNVKDPNDKTVNNFIDEMLIIIENNDSIPEYETLNILENFEFYMKSYL
jgi:hypothetical protein